MTATARLRPTRAALIHCLLWSVTAGHAEPIEEIVVTADYLGRTAGRLPASITVLEADAIEGLAVQHLEELIDVVPNLNWSGDGHRARYLQIRGVGELEQYEGAPNPSVGFLIDDIDFSGIGTIATLFDVERVEVLRGPQGTRFGANALAGLVYVQTAAPTAVPSGRVEVTAGGDDTLAYGGAFGGPLTDDGSLALRVSGQRYDSDGFRHNPWLARDDTNRRRETTARARLNWQPGEDLSIDIATLYADIDDGYDAFAIDNTYTVLSDDPGSDAQQSTGASVRAEWAGMAAATLTSITTYADSDIAFGFDADWGNAASWAPVTYDYVSLNDRERRTLSQELRLTSADAGLLFGRTAWLLGIYGQRLTDRLTTVNRGEYFDPASGFADAIDDTLSSDYESRSLAVFGQIEHPLGEATRLAVGLRLERRSAGYDDTAGLSASPSELMSGGEATLSHDHGESLTSFVSLSKGYKAGGFNLGSVPPGAREFGREALWSLEAGIKASWPAQSLFLSASVFLSRRDDQQVRTSTQLDPGDPASFVFFTDNAARGDSRGLEAELTWLPNDLWDLYLNLGLLYAEFDDYVSDAADLTGRDQAHAPNYSLALGARFGRETGLFARVDATARDAFYFDVSHDQRSEAYELVHARVGWQAANWSVQLWGQNLFDRHYAVRGFYFGNEPPDFPDRLYVRLGDPRQVGVTFELGFGS